ncbi:MAG: hypothetical protein JXR60_01560 [Bacteroidales bacterium]|nr:hypothetical protein [Bacteroidales bacterium]
MEKEIKIASALIVVEKDNPDIAQLNETLSNFSSEIIARQGISLPHKQLNIISLILESDINSINHLAGKIGQLKGIRIRLLIDNKN